jgi:hypothetical protein
MSSNVPCCPGPNSNMFTVIQHKKKKLRQWFSEHFQLFVLHNDASQTIETTVRACVNDLPF